MHIHLDILGGISGDMFVGAMLDCFPDLSPTLTEQLSRAGFSDLVNLDTTAYNDGVLSGTRFQVNPTGSAEAHGHRHYSEIKQIIDSSSLEPGIKQVAQEIFRLLATAEASIHGKPAETVAFHEVGAWDSIADIICAASLIARLPGAVWSMSTLPLGRGQVKTAHGMLPIPAPATALLLEGFEGTDDGIDGERITPTGAAILRYLSPTQGPTGRCGQLVNSGYGFGTKRFPGISNVLRLLIFESPDQTGWLEEQILQLEFEIDDQTPEDLAIGLESIRAQPGVIDVLQYPAFGKKGRQVSSIRVLAMCDQETGIVSACFEQTSTLGIRKQRIDRSILQRDQVTVGAREHTHSVKVAKRPTRQTAKAEMDEVADHGINFATRKAYREQIEQLAISQRGDVDQDE